MGRPFRSMSGHTIGLLFVTNQYTRNKHGAVEWFCKCKCGGTKWVLSERLQHSESPVARSCGCLSLKRASELAVSLVPRTCLLCERRYLGGRSSKYCSRSCQSKNWRSKHPRRSRKCEMCPNEIIGRPGSHTCSETCRLAWVDKRNNELKFGTSADRVVCAILKIGKIHEKFIDRQEDDHRGCGRSV